MTVSVSEILFGMLNWNDKHEDENDPLHAPDLNVALAMLRVDHPEITDEMDDEVESFLGRYYKKIVRANAKANNEYEAFAAIVDPLYAQYQAEIAEYEKKKAEEAAEGDTGFTHPLG